MPNSIFGLAGAAPSAPSAAAAVPSAAPAGQPSASVPDRIVRQGNQLPALLTIGAASAVQLVPGVVEAEGLAGIASAIGIGARAAAANPALSFGGGVALSTLGGYAKALVHDAAMHQPAGQAFAALGHGADRDIRTMLGIPPGEPR